MEDNRQIITVVKNIEGYLVIINATGGETIDGTRSLIKSIFRDIAKSNSFKEPHTLIKRIWADLALDPIRDLLTSESLKENEKLIILRAAGEISDSYLKTPDNKNEETED